MSGRLRIAEDLRRFEPRPGVLIFVRDGSAPITLLGAEWATLIDVAVGEEHAVGYFGTQIPPARLMSMIAHLRSNDILLDADRRVTPYGLVTGSPAAPAIRLSGFGAVDLSSARKVLVCNGVQCDDAANLHLVLTDDYLNDGLAAFNRERIADGESWLLASPDLAEARVGPLFRPNLGPCWQCFAARQTPRRAVRDYLGAGVPRVAVTSTGGATRAAAMMSMITILERFVLTSRDTPFRDHVRTTNFRDGQSRDHRLVRRPQCPECGDPRAAMPRPIGPLRDNRLAVSRDGGERQVEPLISFDSMAHHISPVTGIADTLIEGHVDNEILCYGVLRPAPEAIDSPQGLIRAAAASGLGWGKGWTHVQARMSALGEAIERFTMSDERPPDVHRASFASLGDLPVDPRHALLLSETQYDRCGTGEGHDRIPEARFDPDQVIGWTAARSLTTGRERLIASDQMWLTPLPTRDGCFCIADSNGCAAGNTVEEAILQGIFELVERDAVAIWWYNQLRAPAIDLASFGEAFDQLRHRYATVLRRDLWALDLTVDLGIPVFVAISARQGSGRPEYVACFGSHLDPQIALQRALTELGLMLAGWKDFLSGAATPRTGVPSVTRWLQGVGMQDQLQLRPSAMPVRQRTGFLSRSTGRCASDIGICVDLLRRAGIDVIAADATRPDIGLNVVRVMAPGLRHFRPRFAPGRLYDVPVALGLLESRHGEADLNPIALPF